MEAAFIFGNIGNLSEFVGRGWSVEDQFAWAIGEESNLSLPLPGDAKPYFLRFTLHPLLNPGVRDVQRVMFSVGGEILALFEITRHCTIELPIPPHLTSGKDRLELTLVHPDAMRPSDFQPSDDTRWLALCFHSASLVREDGASDDDVPNADISEPQGVRQAIIAGNVDALLLHRIISKLLGAHNGWAVHYIDTDLPLSDTRHVRLATAVSEARLCWLQAETGRSPVVEQLLATLPPDCEIRRFPIPRMSAFWPFLSADSRAAPEHGRYAPARYPFGDRIAAGLTHYNMADDILFYIYEGSVEKEMPDLDALLQADVMAWKRLDARCDVKLADFLEKTVTHERVFIAPTIPGPAMMRELAARLLASPAIEMPITTILADLDKLMVGYIGRRQELPIHPNVARHFQLAWWSPRQTYRWFSNRRTHKEYILDYIKWTQWRP